MKKHILALLLITGILVGCSKKKDDTVPIDMNLKTYSADAKYKTLPVILQLNFESNGNVRLRAYPDDEVVVLKYEVGDKMASNTTLRIFGELDKSLYVDGLTKGTKIDWKTNIGRLSYKPEIVGFQIGDYHFTSN